MCTINDKFVTNIFELKGNRLMVAILFVHLAI